VTALLRDVNGDHQADGGEAPEQPGGSYRPDHGVL
jgi:hypothetical protein